MNIPVVVGLFVGGLIGSYFGIAGFGGAISFEVDILPQFIARKGLAAYVTDSQYYFITNPKTLNDFKNVVLKNNFVPLPQKYFRE